jgi:NAD(P)-dependent dehydrogenase (short-subunit alcohol dehydrogenase family)
LIDHLVAEAERKVKRLASAFADERDELIAATLRGEMKAAGREREALMAERDTLQADLTQGEMTEAERAEVKALAAEIHQRLADPTFDKRRVLMNLLDVRVKLEWQDGLRGVRVTCAPKPSPPRPNPTNG